MFQTGTTPESRLAMITDAVRSFFPTYSTSSEEVLSALEEHIRTHGYFLQREYSVEISESEYFTSWLEYVLEPVLSQLARIHKTNLIDPLEEYMKVSAIWFTISQSPTVHSLENLQQALKRYIQEATQWKNS